MAKTFSAFYSDELMEWDRTIVFYDDEINELTQKLEEVIRRDSIQTIAGKVEAQQVLLNRMACRFGRLRDDILKQKAILKDSAGAWLEDRSINENLKRSQAVLRMNVQAAEKEYIDIKFSCYNFLSGLLKE